MKTSETILGMNMWEMTSNLSPKGRAVIIECFQCKLTSVIQSYRLYQIIQMVIPQLNDLGEEFSESNISGG